MSRWLNVLQISTIRQNIPLNGSIGTWNRPTLNCKDVYFLKIIEQLKYFYDITDNTLMTICLKYYVYFQGSGSSDY